MDISTDELEYNMSHMPMFEKVLDMFKGNPNFQQIVRRGILANINGTQLDDTSEDEYDYDYRWTHGHTNSHGRDHLDWSRDEGLRCGCTRSSSSLYPLRYYEDARDCPLLSSWKVQAKESDSERQARLLLEAEKSKEKAEKKRIKKKKQKERKQMERMEKEKQNPVRKEEENNNAQPLKEEKKSEPAEESKSSVKAFAAAKYTECSNSTADESSNEDGDTASDLADTEELDMTSSFVSKAARIVQRKMEQNPKSERKERKKTQVKEEPETVPDKPNTDPQSNDERPVTPEAPTMEDTIRKSAELANLGNKFASAGDYDRAIMHYTDAIKYNPKEFRFFGNRSFCFEKQRKFVKALTDAELSLSLCPGWVKGLFRKGRALAGLKKYEDAARAFREVLKVDSSCVEASQELWRVQIAQLMLYGFTRAQSSNALSIHGTVKEAAEFLAKMSNKPGAYQNGAASPLQVVNVGGVSPVLSANVAAAAPQPQDGAHAPPRSKSWGPAQSQPKSTPDPAPQELYPVWVGNLNHPVTEVMITDLFNKVGVVYSVKLLTSKRCAFINFTKREHCDEAIRQFHGFEFNGCRLAVRYPDRIPPGMGISRSALRADNLQDETVGNGTNINGRNAAGSRRPARGFRPDHRVVHQQ